MNVKTTILSVLLFTGITGLISCSKSNNSSVNQNAAADQLKQGSWKVTNFWDKDHDETISFSGFEITFNSDGSVSAVNSATTVAGNWTMGADDSQPKLTLLFSDSPFTDINNDWHIVDQSSAIIHLENISGGNGTTELLTLEKI